MGGKTIHAKDFLVKEDTKVNLKKFNTAYTGKELGKEKASQLLDESRKELAENQSLLYAHNRHSVLIIFQAMDAAGKDGAIKHVMSGFNPQGVKVYSFKAPTSTELDHQYLWRHMITLPAHGEIAIHNRSHYENVLVTRVHPEYILGEQLPGIESVKDIDKSFWEERFKQIRRFEKSLASNGMVIIKFFLHVSKKEQKKRFLERIDDPSKNWKFAMSDLNERGHWDNYQEAYEDVLEKTSMDIAPWYVIPADDKWYARLAVASVILETFQGLDMHYPKVTKAQKEELLKARAVLMDEK
ncbi:MAG TPA: polyphosphate kinase 2 family protein [Cyclobacteriaceae bacterium]|nr:polyphosphate kinase 2 family protein [Cyclobacteriaceae bacterium]